MRKKFLGVLVAALVGTMIMTSCGGSKTANASAITSESEKGKK